MQNKLAYKIAVMRAKKRAKTTSKIVDAAMACERLVTRKNDTRINEMCAFVCDQKQSISRVERKKVQRQQKFAFAQKFPSVARDWRRCDSAIRLRSGGVALAAVIASALVQQRRRAGCSCVTHCAPSSTTTGERRRRPRAKAEPPGRR